MNAADNPFLDKDAVILGAKLILAEQVLNSDSADSISKQAVYIKRLQAAKLEADEIWNKATRWNAT